MENIIFWVIKLPVAFILTASLVILDLISSLILDIMEFFAWSIAKLLGTENIDDSE